MCTSTTHVRAQFLRFARVSALAFVVQLAATGGAVSWSSLWALAAGAAEAGLRQVAQTAPVPRVTAVPASPVAPPGSGAP